MVAAAEPSESERCKVECGHEREAHGKGRGRGWEHGRRRVRTGEHQGFRGMTSGKGAVILTTG